MSLDALPVRTSLSTMPGGESVAPSVRTVSTTERRSVRIERTRYSSTRQLPSSAQCTSSTTNRVGQRAAASRSSPLNTPNIRPWSGGADVGSTGIPGSSGARSRARRPASSRNSSVPRWRRRSRNTSRNGPHGTSRHSALEQAPRRTSGSPTCGSWCNASRNSLTSRVFPRPASPSTRRTRGLPARPAATTSSRAASSTIATDHRSPVERHQSIVAPRRPSVTRRHDLSVAP